MATIRGVERESTNGLMEVPQGTHKYTHVRDRRSRGPDTDLSSKLMIVLSVVRCGADGHQISLTTEHRAVWEAGRGQKAPFRLFFRGGSKNIGADLMIIFFVAGGKISVMPAARVAAVNHLAAGQRRPGT